MNKITKKLILSVLTVILAVGALGTTTFAWFTLSNVAKVSQFEADIRGEGGIEISVDKASVAYASKNWYNNISETLIKSVYTELDEFKFNHVTTDGTSFYSIKDHNVLVENATTNPLINVSYIEFDIYFRSPDFNEINLTGITLFGDTVSWGFDISVGDYDNEDSIFVNPINALRISFTGMQIIDEELILNTQAYERADYDEDEDAENTYLGNEIVFANNLALQYYAAKNDGAYPSKDSAFTPIDTIGIELDEEYHVVLGEDEIMTFYLDDTYEYNNITYNVGKLTVRVWIEGFDAESFNAILGKPISFGFEFEGTEFVELPEPVEP